MKSQITRNTRRTELTHGTGRSSQVAPFINIPPYFQVSVIGIACLVAAMTASTALATPLSLSQTPPGSGGSEPAPNVIITVDDSGSMGWDVNGCMTLDWRTDVYGLLNDGTNCPARDANPNPSRIASLKSALITQFGDPTANPPTLGKVADNRIRLAWQAMHNNGNAPGANNLTAGATNAMRPFSGSQRSSFNTFINSLSSVYGTPSHQMMSNVYNYARTAQGIDSPWADNPGTAQSTPYLACRRMYHIFMTDGAWNSESALFSVGNSDGTARTLGDGTTSYNPTSTQVAAYKDAFGGTAGSASTLSDFAFNNWASDLQDGAGGTQNMTNTVRPLIKESGTQTVGTTSLQEFWNPKNDSATWQHIVQHSIGFANTATKWPGAPSWDSITDSTYSGDYTNLVNGTVGWQNVLPATSGNDNPARASELWHMALNGRGKYYPARTPEALTAAFSDILNNILTDTSKPLVSIAASSSSLRSGLNAYIAGYSAEKWVGSLTARPVDSTTAAISSSEAWNAVTLLDATTYSVSNRFVLSYDSSLTTQAGINWSTWSSLPAGQKTPLGKNSSGTVDSNGQSRVDYLRGDRTKETAQTSGIFRDRSSRLGDIVNSNIWYTGKPSNGYTANGYATFRSATATGGKGGRTPMIYVGANDGMLHGFAAANWPNDASIAQAGGKELLAYIPEGVAQGDLRKLTDTSYSHQYFVDGSPFSGDAYIGTTPAWTTVLVGTLGAGGKGYFVLNATDPAQFTAANAGSLVIADKTASADQDIGIMISPPVIDDAIAGKSRQIVKMNNDRWAVVMGNGYNSTNEAPVLLIQYLDGDKSIKKVSPCTLPTSVACTFKGGNGLSSPQLIDLNGDGKVDVAYAGDLKGNLWKFNLTSTNTAVTDWSTSFSGQPFFVASYSATVKQPITTAPFWMQHPLGGVMLAVGTGQNLTLADQTSTGIDSLYAVYDNSQFTTSSNGVSMTDGTPINTTLSTRIPSSLVQQTITSTLTDVGTTYYTTSNTPVSYTGSSPKRGWYLNWSNNGQRVLHNPKAYTGQKVLFQSTIPKSAGSSNAETCTPLASPERSFLSILNVFTGNPSAQAVFTLTNTSIPNQNVTTIEGNPGGDNWLVRTDDKVKILNANCPTGQTCNTLSLNYLSYMGLRANWREIQ